MIPLIAVAVKLLPRLITLAESLFGKKAGAQKKQAVMNSSADMLNMVLAMPPSSDTTSTAGVTNDSAEMQFISSLIDAEVEYMTAKGLLPAHTK